MMLEDPQSILPLAKTGGINIIDLANINSCPFIATMDLGKLHEDGPVSYTHLTLPTILLV